MVAAGILFGLTPNASAYLDSSPHETAAVSGIGRRPFLALCLGVGPPTIMLSAKSQYKTGFQHAMREGKNCDNFELLSSDVFLFKEMLSGPTRNEVEPTHSRGMTKFI